jgi:dissimilatory sulfite reductase (desulfoviridin) alpha/beta subunit
MNAIISPATLRYSLEQKLVGTHHDLHLAALIRRIGYGRFYATRLPR